MKYDSQLSPPPQGPAAAPLFPAVLEANPEGRMLDVALAYAEAGIPVFPCYEKAEENVNDKGETFFHPVKSPRVNGGYKTATADLEQVRAWWRQWPKAMIGMPTAGLVVVDLDAPKGGPGGRNGLETWRLLLEKFNGGRPLEGVPMVRTGSGGRHLFFRKGEGPRFDRIKGRANLPTGLEAPGCLSGLDVRTGGGHVVAAGSRTADGKAYELLSNPAGGPPQLPDWLLPIVAGEIPAAPAPLLQSAGESDPGRAAPAFVPSGAALEASPAMPPAGAMEAQYSRNARISPYGRAALEANCRKIAALTAGNRHDGIRKYSIPIFRLVSGGEISDGLAYDTLLKACLSMAEPGPERELRRLLTDFRAFGVAYPLRAPRDWSVGAVEALEAETPAPATATVSETLQEWEEVDPFVKPRPEALPPEVVEALPDSIRDFVRELSDYVGVPLELALFTVLAFRAMSVQGFAEVDFGAKSSTVNLYCVPILESGERKSTALSVIFSSFFDRFELDVLDRYAEVRRKCRTRNASLEAKITALTRSIGKDTTRAERLEIDRRKGELERQLVQIPASPRFYAQDVTPEKLGELTASNCDRLAVFEAEGTFLEILDGRYSNGVPRYELLLKAYDGEAYKFDRKSGDTLEFFPIITLFCAVQPDVLRRRRNKDAARGRGFDPRCFYFYPPSKKGTRRGLERERHQFAHGAEFYALIEEALRRDPVCLRLASLEEFLKQEEAERTAAESAPAAAPAMAAPGGESLGALDLSEVECRPWSFPSRHKKRAAQLSEKGQELEEINRVRFDDEAFEILAAYQAREEFELRPNGGESADISEWACRKTESVARLACLLHSLRPLPEKVKARLGEWAAAADFRAADIGRQDTENAIAIVEWLAGQYRFVAREFLGANIDADELTEDVTRALQVLDKVKAATKGMEVPSISWRDCFQHCRRTMTKKDFEKAVNSLTVHRFVQQVRPAQPEGEAKRGRRAQPEIYLNPEARRAAALLSEE